MYGSASRWLSADELINVGSKPRPVSSVNMCHLTAKVLAAGGRVGYKEGRFSFHRGAATGLKRGDLHKSIDGIYFWARHKRDSIWLDEALYHEMDHKRLDAIRLMSEEESLRRKARQAAWRANNRKRLAAGSRRWARKNKAKNSERAARRREVGATANQAIIDSRYTAREFLKANTDIDWHVDHTVPISKGGKHHEDNLQVVPAGWNRSKGANHCDRWIEDSNIYRYATAVEKRFEEEAKKSEEK